MSYYHFIYYYKWLIDLIQLTKLFLIKICNFGKLSKLKILYLKLFLFFRFGMMWGTFKFNTYFDVDLYACLQNVSVVLDWREIHKKTQWVPAAVAELYKRKGPYNPLICYRLSDDIIIPRIKPRLSPVSFFWHTVHDGLRLHKNRQQT